MPEIQHDIYRLNPKNTHHKVALSVHHWELVYQNKNNDDTEGKIDWQKYDQNRRDFYRLLINDQKALLDQLYVQPTTVDKIMSDAPNIAAFFGLTHAITQVRCYDDSLPRAYLTYPHTFLLNAGEDQEIFPEFKTLDKHRATLDKGAPLVINDLPLFAYISCPQEYDGTLGFVPEDAVKLTPEQLTIYRERERLAHGGGWLDGFGCSFMPTITGSVLPDDFDPEKHQYQDQVIPGGALLSTVVERWNACNKEDAERCVPLPSFPTKWAEAHGMA